LASYDGAVRFDGAKSTLFAPAEVARIFSVYEDKEHRIWLASDEGVWISEALVTGVEKEQKNGAGINCYLTQQGENLVITSDNEIIDHVVVLNTVGSKLLDETAGKNSVILNVSNLPAGLYMAFVETEGDVTVKKIYIK
jgi:hypothetical protein